MATFNRRGYKNSKTNQTKKGDKSQTAEVFEFISADNPVSFSALLPDFFVIPKHVSFEFLKLCFF